MSTQTPTPAEGASEPAVDVRRQLVERSAVFATAYLRWIDSGCDGLSYPRLRLLEQLHCRGPQMMRILADEIGLTPRNMTALVDATEAEGLVRRMAHPTDRRAVLIELTDRGFSAAEEILEPRARAIAELFDDLSPTEQARLNTALATVLDGLRRRGQRV
jgi:DNA-binding MarR family transcriptional regulator